MYDCFRNYFDVAKKINIAKTSGPHNENDTLLTRIIMAMYIYLKTCNMTGCKRQKDIDGKLEFIHKRKSTSIDHT